MKNGVEDFVVESTPVLDLKKQGFTSVGQPGLSSNEVNWDADRTEVYSDGDADGAVASLVGEHGELFPITTFPYVMGRGSECDLVLQGKGVSRRHAEIIFQSGRFVVNDLESLNGIKVNGYKVSRVILEENDSIKLGEVNLTFQSGSSAKPVEESRSSTESNGKFSFLKGSKNKQPKAVESISDDTFGPSPTKKLITNLVLVVAILMVGMVGFQYWQGQQQVAGRVVEIGGVSGPASSTPAVVAPKNVPTAEPASVASPPADAGKSTNQAPVSTDTAADTVADAPPVVSTDPPPSISLPTSIAKSATISKPAAEAAKVAVAPVPKEAAPKLTAPVKPIVAPGPAVSDATVNAALRKAEDAYFSGNAESAISLLKPYQQSSGLSTGMRKEVATASGNYSALYNQYMTGQQSFSRNNKEEAFQAWVGFMNNEAAIFKGRKSSYTQSISSRVVNEYVDLGNEAAKAGDNHKAYRMWQKALDIGDSVAARIAIDNANNRAMQLYRQALRLEYVNTNKAKAMWHEVTELLPPGTEYNTKASSKLAWYEKWGS